MKELLLSLTLVLIALGMANSSAEEVAEGSRTVIEINGQPFSEAHFMAFGVQQGKAQDMQSQQAQLALLNKLASTVLVAQDAEKEKLDEHPQVKAAIDMARIQVLAEVQITSYLAAKPITDATITDVSHSPTLTYSPTQAGVLLGTADGGHPA